MTEQSTIAAKLQKLILLLSSDQPGEVAAAAAAIGRTLKQAGADWHTLAGALTRTPSSPQQSPPPQAPPRMRPGRLMAAWIIDNHGDALTPKEYGFVWDMQHWTRLSPKQQDWLIKIFKSLGGEVLQ